MPQDAAKMTFTLHYTKKDAEIQYIFHKKLTFNINITFLRLSDKIPFFSLATMKGKLA